MLPGCYEQAQTPWGPVSGSQLQGMLLRSAAPRSAVASSEAVTQEFFRSQHRASASWLSLTSCSAVTVPASGVAKGLPELTSSAQLNVLPQAFSRVAVSTHDLCPESFIQHTGNIQQHCSHFTSEKACLYSVNLLATEEGLPRCLQGGNGDSGTPGLD